MKAFSSDMRSGYLADIKELFLYSRVCRTHIDLEGNFDYMSSIARKETILFSTVWLHNPLCLSWFWKLWQPTDHFRERKQREKKVIRLNLTWPFKRPLLASSQLKRLMIIWKKWRAGLYLLYLCNILVLTLLVCLLLNLPALKFSDRRLLRSFISF